MAAQSVPAINASIVARFGEAVTLPDGRTVYGVFDAVGDAPGGFGSEVGLRGRLSAQPNPTLDLTDADAAGLDDGAQVRVRGADYLVTRMDPDGAGLTHCLLMPAAASGAAPTERLR